MENGGWAMPFHFLLVCSLTLGHNSAFSRNFLCSIGHICQGREVPISPEF